MSRSRSSLDCQYKCLDVDVGGWFNLVVAIRAVWDILGNLVGRQKKNGNGNDRIFFRIIFIWPERRRAGVTACWLLMTGESLVASVVIIVTILRQTRQASVPS